MWSGGTPEKSPISRLILPKTWLSNCLKHHDRCNALETSNDYTSPTRLIEISSTVPCLVMLEGDTKVKYAALSHCWGGHQPITTTLNNIENHRSAIPLPSMPKTFQDAILVTQQLGINYIWVDSLCIIQDSASDWANEAARMASVYSGALFTIAAVWGSNGTCGCFHDRLPPLTITIHEKRKIGTHITNATGHMYLRPVPEPRRYVGEAILNTRAWTLQEIVLSRRTILFAEDQMYWFCTSLYESEDGLESMDPVPAPALNLPSLGPVARNGDQSKDLLYESWQITMNSYSSRNLTKGKDKFAALAGITEFFGSVIEDEAVAGLWKGDLGRGLMWKVPAGKHGEKDEEVAASLGVPSWSWVKVKGPVDTSVADTKLCAEDLDAIVKWDGLPMTSRIVDGIVRGKGRILKITEVEKTGDEECFCLGARNIAIEGQEGNDQSFKVYWYMDECTDAVEADLSFLLVRFNDIKDVKWETTAREVAALIVARMENSQDVPTFRRVGVGDIIELPQTLYQQAPSTDFRLI